MPPARLEARMDSLLSFPVGLFHPLQHAGLSRRTRFTDFSSTDHYGVGRHRKVAGVAEADGCRTGRGRRHLSGIPIYGKRMSRETLPRRETTLNVARFCVGNSAQRGCDRSPQTERSERQRHAKPKHTPPAVVPPGKSPAIRHLKAERLQNLVAEGGAKPETQIAVVVANAVGNGFASSNES